jgi:dienelactone hydrolase
VSIDRQLVEYRDGDTVLEGLMARDTGSTADRPGVLIAHAWGGRGEYEDNKARALA